MTAVIPGDPNAQVSTILAQAQDPYKYSANLAQGIIAAIEARFISKEGMNHSILIGALVLLSSMVPPGGIFNIYGVNEKLWETLIATFIGGAILKVVSGGSYLKRAGLMLLIDTSSMALTDEVYTAFILGGINPNYEAYRVAYPNAGYINRAFLG